MIKYYKVEEIYHSKLNTETFEYEVLATKLGRVLYKKGIEDSAFVKLCLESNDHQRTEITEEEFLVAKEEFKNKI
jgi:hypothetical protein